MYILGKKCEAEIAAPQSGNHRLPVTLPYDIIAPLLPYDIIAIAPLYLQSRYRVLAVALLPLMDPVSAFSLACGVIQIVDFSIKTVSSCRRLYKEGSLSENGAIEGWAEHLTELIAELKIPIEEAAVRALPPNEQELLKLATECSATARDLIQQVNSLKVSGPRKKREAFKKGVRALWREDVMEDIQKRLDSYQKLLDTKVLISIRYV